MELRILSPQEGGFIKEIKWNNEELKKEVALKMEEYKTLVYTDDTIKDAKVDRATLNKLVKAIDDERKRIKKLCMAPFEQFEAQVKELIGIIDEPIKLIDKQIKEVEEQKRTQKRIEIAELFKSIGFQCFVTLDSIFDEKWLNASVPLSKIEESMKTTMYRIGNEVATISRLPEFSFEAMETYKRTLDMAKAIQEGQRLAEIQKRKSAYEEEQKRKAEEEASRNVQPLHVQESKISEEQQPNERPLQDDQLYIVDFRIKATKENLELLKNFLRLNHITYGPVPKKGE